MDDFAHLNPPAALPAILGRTEALAFPMPSEPRTGAMLRVLAASKPRGRLLELGTGTGLCTAWLLDGMDQDFQPDQRRRRPKRAGRGARVPWQR